MLTKNRTFSLHTLDLYFHACVDSIKNTGEAFHLVPIPCELILTTPRGKGGTQMLGYQLERNLRLT
jgi:hypothetical protein